MQKLSLHAFLKYSGCSGLHSIIQLGDELEPHLQGEAEEEQSAPEVPLDLAGERLRASGIIASLLNGSPAEVCSPLHALSRY